MKKERGKFLTLALISIIFLSVVALYMIPTFSFKEMYDYAPSWISQVVIFNLLVDITALLGIWMWKKVAVYVFVLSVIIGILSESLILRPTEEALADSIMGIAMYGLFLWAVSRKWKYFS